MTGFDLLDAMAGICDEYILEARQVQRTAPRMINIAAAILCALLIGTISIGKLLTKQEEMAPNPMSPAEATVVAEDGSANEESAVEPIVEAEMGDHNTEVEKETLFFNMFHELDRASFMNYVKEHPSVLENGWDNVYINEAGLDDEGTSIETTEGEQVLAVDAKNGILIFRVYINNSRGLFAVLKDASRLSLKPASSLGDEGRTVGNICDENNGIFAINGSAFYDDGSSNGGQIMGLAICDGQSYGSRLYGAYKRIELREDGKMYVVDSAAPVTSDTLQACEFLPALIIDGQIVVDENCGWTAYQPRTVIGQSDKLEIQIVVCEGRYLDSPGTGVVEIAELMYKHGCVQALNLDGGTSSMMYYNGEYLNRCSNTELPNGRAVPTAWVYQ